MLNEAKKIILVDDMTTNHLIFKSHLKEFNYNIECFKDSQNLVEKIDHLMPPDLFVLDIEMPGIDGIELAKIIKSKKTLEKIPIIFFSTLDDDKALIKAFEVGAIEFISKSMKATELKLRIQNIFHLESLKAQTEILNFQLSQKLQLNQILFRVLFHDLANLISIIDANNTLAMAKLEEHPTFKRLEKSAHSIEQLRDILTSIRSLTETAIKNEPTSLKDAFKNLEFVMQDRLKQKSLSLSTICENKLLVNVPKSFLVHQILANFMTNAIKFSPMNAAIELKAYTNEDGVTIELTDQGPGMSEEVISKIMSEDQFYTSEGTQQEKGTGSGVKIAQFFITKFSGSLSYHQSSRPPGTTVRLNFR